MEFDDKKIAADLSFGEGWAKEELIRALDKINLIDGLGRAIEAQQREIERIKSLAIGSIESVDGIIEAPPGFYFAIEADSNGFDFSVWQEEAWSEISPRKLKGKSDLDKFIFIASKIQNHPISRDEAPGAAFAYSPFGQLRCRVNLKDKVTLVDEDDLPDRTVNPNEVLENKFIEVKML